MLGQKEEDIGMTSNLGIFPAAPVEVVVMAAGTGTRNIKVRADPVYPRFAGK